MNKKSYRLMKECIEKLSLPVGEDRIKALSLYADLLFGGLSRIRITGEQSLEDIVNKQIYDSLYLCKLIEPCDGKLVDLGTGGGLPGIPLKIVMPECSLYLLDSNKKKATFLRDTISRLQLSRATIVEDRAENAGRNPEMREGFDCLVSKAVAQMNILLELSLPLVKTGGKAYLYKGPRGEEEVKEAHIALTALGGRMGRKWEYVLPGGESRSIYEVIKIFKTPDIYPRAPGRPAKKPLK